MNISRNVLLAALVTLTLPVVAEEANITQQTQTEDKKSTEQNADKGADKDKGTVVEDKSTGTDKSKEADKTEKKDTAEAKKEEEKSFFGKVGALIAAPFVFTGNGAKYVVETIAAYGGAQTIVSYLASASKDKDGKDVAKGAIATFFTNHGSKVQNTLALVEVAALLYGANEVYKKFVVESEDNEDEYADVEFVDFANDN